MPCAAHTSNPRGARRLAPLLVSALLVSALLVLVSAALIGCSEDEEPIPQMLPIAPFTLTDQGGEEFGTAQLRGKVWIADMIFTSCPDICPVLSSKMANLHRRIEHPEVHFVSVTVDPEVDTPDTLRAYAGRYGADTERWAFLTGAPEEVHRVILHSFRLPDGERTDRADGQYDILHSSRFLLVDQDLTLRGLYETDREGLSRLERDVQRLLEER